MICTGCGAECRPGASFCSHCGTPLQEAPIPRGAAPQMIPTPAHQPPLASGQPSKDRIVAFILEFLLLGLGWIYAGNAGTGIIILASWLIVGLGGGITVNIITGGFGCLCTVPLSITAYALSLTQLSKYMNARPHVFR